MPDPLFVSLAGHLIVDALTTKEILAHRLLGTAPDDRWIGWAVEMLVRGHDTPTLRIMAGETAPFRAFEIWEMTDQVLRELDLALPSDEGLATRRVFAAYLREMVSREVSQEEGLRVLSRLVRHLELSGDFFDFYLLHYGLSDIQEHGEQHYWPEAHDGNIREIIDEHCRRWLHRHD